MIITESLLDIDDQIEVLIQAILSSEEIQLYKKNRERMYASREVMEKQKLFKEAKQNFEKIENYGKHAPDFRTKQRAVRQAKRALDMCEEVAEFRFSETSLQTILDIVGLKIAETISENIKVDVGNPFFEKKKNSSCGGSCHAG